MHLNCDIRNGSFGGRQIAAHQKLMVQRDFSDDSARVAKEFATPKIEDAEFCRLAGKDLETGKSHGRPIGEVETEIHHPTPGRTTAEMLYARLMV